MRAIILYTKASLLFVSICTMANVAKEIVLGRIHDVCFGEPDVGVAISLGVEAPSTAGVRTTSKWSGIHLVRIRGLVEAQVQEHSFSAREISIWIGNCPALLHVVDFGAESFS